MNGIPQWRRLHRAVTWLRFALRAGRIGRFLYDAVQRFLADGCLRLAAGLSYASLLAIVPLFAIALAVLAGFPAFAPLRADLQTLVLDNLLPDAGLEVSEQLGVFVENASKMTGPGLVGLAVTVILLMSNINGALNGIWRVAEARPLALRITVYWVLLTLGPLLLGASVSVSGYAFAAVEWYGIEDLGLGFLRISRLISVSLAVLGFGFLYFLVPNRAVHPLHALAGGAVAGVLFELLQIGFGLYLKHFPSYQLVYGAVSAVPIFLVWMYLAWAVALFGAEVAAALPEWRAARARGGAVMGAGGRLALALSLIARMRDASRTGRKLRERQVAQRLPATPSEIDTALQALRRAGIVDRTLGGRWLLARDLDSLTLGELADTLGVGLAPGDGWHPAAGAAVDDLAAAARAQAGRSVAEVLADRDQVPHVGRKAG